MLGFSLRSFSNRGSKYAVTPFCDVKSCFCDIFSSSKLPIDDGIGSAIQIDGVAYFEATIIIDDTPTWLRSGLNADVDIKIQALEEVNKLPKRFVYNENDKDLVKVKQNGELTEMEVNVLFVGNDGYTAIEGLAPGTVVIAP